MYIEFIDLEIMGVAVGILQLFCIHSEYHGGGSGAHKIDLT